MTPAGNTNQNKCGVQQMQQPSEAKEAITMKLKLIALLMVVGMSVPARLPAAEILTQDDFVKKVVKEDNLVKTADNLIILFDTSHSMARQFQKGSPESRYDVSKRILKEKIQQLPDLGL